MAFKRERLRVLRQKRLAEVAKAQGNYLCWATSAQWFVSAIAVAINPPAMMMATAC
jgi:hypothetical protein